jgi:hypothetical protein
MVARVLELPQVICSVMQADDLGPWRRVDSIIRGNMVRHLRQAHCHGRYRSQLEDWNEQSQEAGIGVTRKADLNDIRSALLSKGLVCTYGDRWAVAHE